VAPSDAGAAPDTGQPAPAADGGIAAPSAAMPGPATPLAWVNPARCHTRCSFDPAAALVRVDDAGLPSPKGRHRLAADAQAPLRQLLVAARAAGHVLKVNSAYRSYREQARVFKTTVQRGRAARPGHSEHQLGTAIDLRLPTSAAIDWLAEHAGAFGFVRSYPDGKQRITGYRPEPWHIRFVGPALAAQIDRNGGTIEELFRAQPGAGESGTCGDCPLPASRAPCGDVTTAGICQGDVLLWCYDGALAAVDCTASQQTCGAAPEPGALPGQRDCLAPPVAP
jgi:zinc D-Ala-D-Ala carboxypeptidase